MSDTLLFRKPMGGKKAARLATKFALTEGKLNGTRYLVESISWLRTARDTMLIRLRPWNRYYMALDENLKPVEFQMYRKLDLSSLLRHAVRVKKAK